jgi:ankyrin repeat protein
MKYIRLYEERLKDFEIMTNPDHQMLIGELVKEIEKKDYDLGYIRDLVIYGHFDIDLIWKDNRDVEWSFLQKASALNKWEIVKVLLDDGGADPNLQKSDGFTALHYASRSGHPQVVQELLNDSRTNPNLKTLGGYTALIIASLNGHSQVVEELLKHPNIDQNIQDRDGYTAWDFAKPEIRKQFPELKPEVE